MKKSAFMKKKLLMVALSIAMAFAAAVPAFADGAGVFSGGNPEYASFSSVGNTAYQLNAYTEGMPTNKTPVTMWVNTGSSTQRWNTIIPVPNTSGVYWMKNAANTGVVLAYNGGSNAILATADPWQAANQGIKFVFEGIGPNGYSKTGLVLPQRLLAVTASGYYNGAPVQWLGSNGLNNQLWYGGLYA